MGLSKFSGVHPFVADRVRYLLDIADRHGGRYQVTSGVRTGQKQWELYAQNAWSGTPTAEPGCSQHQYGLAMDVQFTRDIWQKWFIRNGVNVGLTSVRGDPVHLQAIPGGQFRAAVEPLNICPDPRYAQRVQEVKDQVRLAAQWSNWADNFTIDYARGGFLYR